MDVDSKNTELSAEKSAEKSDVPDVVNGNSVGTENNSADCSESEDKTLKRKTAEKESPETAKKIKSNETD